MPATIEQTQACLNTHRFYSHSDWCASHKQPIENGSNNAGLFLTLCCAQITNIQLY